MPAPQRVPWRTTFNPERDFVVRRPLTVAGQLLARGDPFPKTAVPLRRLRQLYDQRVIHYPGETPGARIDKRPTGLGAAIEAAMAGFCQVEPEVEPATPDDLTASAGVAGDAFTERRDVIVPDDWRGLSWPKRRALAALLTDEPVANAAQVEAAITAELERRGQPV